MKYITLVLVAGALLSTFNVASAWGDLLYHVTDLGTLGGTFSEAFDISNSNSSIKVVGYSSNGSNDDRAFLYDSNSAPPMKNLGVLSGGNSSTAQAINTAGKVVGWSNIGGYNYHAFLYDGVNMTDLDSSYSSNTYARDINDSDLITGSMIVGGYGHAFIYDGTLHDIHKAGATTSIGYGINNNGHAVGEFTVSGVTHAFLYDGTQMNDLGLLEGTTGSSGRGTSTTMDK